MHTVFLQAVSQTEVVDLHSGS